MKKILALLFMCSFALAGCSKEVSVNEAEDIANDIKSHITNVDSISELKVKRKFSSHYNGTSNRQLINRKKEDSYIYELSSRFNYIHLRSISSDEDKVEKSSVTSEKEQWFYMKRKVLYKATRTKTKGNETKTYSKVERYSDAIKEFSDLFDNNIRQAYLVAKGEEFLDIDNFEEFVDEEYIKGMSYAAKFYSSGEGNLKVVGAAKLIQDENADGKASGVGTLSCKWNKYLLSSASISFSVKNTDGTNKNDMKFSAAISEKVSNLIIPSYPNLSHFAENSPSYFY